MTKSRLLVLGSTVVVVTGVAGALGALYFDPARAAVGPLPAEALALPAETRFVMGLDVQRFVASPFYRKYADAASSGRPQPFQELEEKTGLNPERDVDYVYVGGRNASAGARGGDGVLVVTGRFDRYKVGRAIETEKRAVTTKSVQGTTVYLFDESRAGAAKGAAAFLDDGVLVLGTQGGVESVIATRQRGETPLRSNAALMALLEGVKPGSTFWAVGDQTMLQSMPRTIPAPGGAPGASQSLELPALKSLTVTGDLDPQVSLDLTGEAADEAAARSLADVVRGFVALASLQAGQKPELKQLASAVSVTTEATKVRVTARFPYELLDALQPKRPRVTGDPAPPPAGN